MFDVTKLISSPNELIKQLPVQPALAKTKASFDTALKENFLHKKKFVVVVGPCSADDPAALLEYCQKLKKLADSVAEKLLVVVRVYTAKPHSDGDGYFGLSFHDKADEAVDFEKGLYKCRQMMLNCLEVGLPIADELLFFDQYNYFGDLVSYWFLGARSSSDTMHRSYASGLDTVVGVKNGTDGNLLQTAQSLYAIGKPKAFLHAGMQIQTNGNKFAHAVLRGYSTNEQMNSNLDVQTVAKLKDYCNKLGVAPFVMVDASHANSNKIAKNQIKNALEAASNRDVNGLMIESYLHHGKGCGYGISQTDECLSFEETEDLILKLYNLR
ncbi:MAG: 3-deoxy-7-phosphoheptulonate synthase [Clostridia bacterium]|nr:3-deoxy-7-phosphoheptulonate synthase [Clostridia bacterium]